KLRIFERARDRVVPRGLGLAGIEFAADDPLPAEPRIRGAHNRENAAAATAAARALGVEDAAIAEGPRTFPGVAHRSEPVAEGCDTVAAAPPRALFAGALFFHSWHRHVAARAASVLVGVGSPGWEGLGPCVRGCARTGVQARISWRAGESVQDEAR